MRDEAALEAFYQEVIDSYPSSMLPWARNKGITERQLRMTMRILIRREKLGDISATASLDQYEALMRERHQRGGEMPNREGV